MRPCPVGESRSMHSPSETKSSSQSDADFTLRLMARYFSLELPELENVYRKESRGESRESRAEQDGQMCSRRLAKAEVAVEPVFNFGLGSLPTLPEWQQRLGHLED